MLVDKDSFDRFPMIARQARFAPWCAHHKRAATPRAVMGNRPSVGFCGPPDALRSLPDAGASRYEPRLPGGPQNPIKWVFISEHWYQP